MSANDAARRSGAEPLAVEARIADPDTWMEPDPLFRRRLRSQVMNRSVAIREGIAIPSRRRRLAHEMGRLGRACLVASVALCATAAGVLAASQRALPGDPLYALKLGVEELRVGVLPSQFQDDLAISMLTERVDEMRRLAEAGSMAEALALAPAIKQQHATLRLLVDEADRDGPSWLAHRLEIVARLVAALPPELRGVVAGMLPGLPIASPDLGMPAVSPATDSPEAVNASPAGPAPAVNPPPAVPGAVPGGPVPAAGGDAAGAGNESGGGAGDSDDGGDGAGSPNGEGSGDDDSEDESDDEGSESDDGDDGDDDD